MLTTNVRFLGSRPTSWPTESGGTRLPQQGLSAAAASEEARRIFQKLWTDEDEIALLQGFLDFTSQRGTTYSDYQYDTAPFFDQIRPRLKIHFNRNQLAEKLHRHKRKYGNAVNRSEAGKKSVFKSPHDLATFDISRKIWNTSFSRARKPKSTDRTPIPHADLSQDAFLMMRNPKEVEKDEYNEFYKNTFNEFLEPLGGR